MGVTALVKEFPFKFPGSAPGLCMGTMNEYMWCGEEPRKFYMCVGGYKD